VSPNPAPTIRVDSASSRVSFHFSVSFGTNSWPSTIMIALTEMTTP
jgi:hypothetical protein